MLPGSRRRVPKWKTLILTDQGGSRFGRVLYSRRHSSLTGTTGNPEDWICTVQLPEHKDVLLSTWREVWYDQLRQQVNQTTVEQQAIETASQSTSQRFLARSIPAYNAGKGRIIDN